VLQSTRNASNGPAEFRRHDVARRISLVVAYDLWLGSCEAALAALATASRSRTLSTSETAAHQAAISAERELVTREFTLLVGADLLEKSRVPQASTDARKC
jgi:hypothetical protein